MHSLQPFHGSSVLLTFASCFFFWLILISILLYGKILKSNAVFPKMSHSKRSRYSCSPSPCEQRYSRSRSTSRSRSRSREESVENPGNNLYVTGLSPRITKKEIEKHFSNEGKVVDVHLVVEPWTRESRGFGFVTLSTVEEADRCIKYLDGSVLHGRVITVEKARRCKGRTPTPGRYLGLKTVRVRRRSPSYSPRYSSERNRSRSRSYSPYRNRYSTHYSSDRDRGRSHSLKSRRHRYLSLSRSLSPCSRSPMSRRDRSPYSPFCHRQDRSHSPDYRRHYRSYSPDDSWYDSPDERVYHRSSRRRYRSISRSVSPGLSSRSRRRYSRYRAISRSVSPRWRRSYSHSVSRSPRRRSRRSPRHNSPDSSRSYSRGRSVSQSSRSISRSATPTSSSRSS